MLTRLDCGNATLVGLPTCQLNRLQSVLHVAARLVCAARKYDHVTPLLQELQRLSVLDRIPFKLYSGVCTSSLRLTLLGLLTVQQTSTHGAGCAKDRQQRYWSRWLDAALSVTALFQSRLHKCGTVYLSHWLHSHHCYRSGSSSRRSCLSSPIRVIPATLP